MIRRRATYDPLQPSDESRWLTVRTFGGHLLEARRLEPGTNLVRAFLTAMLELVDGGWLLGEFGSAGAVVRYERGTEKRMMSVESQDPEDSAEHRSWGGQCVNCGD